MTEISLDEIECSYCSSPATHKNQYNETACDQCHIEHVHIARDIKRHEQKLANKNYFGYPEQVTIPKFIPIEKDNIVKIRDKNFKVI